MTHTWVLKSWVGSLGASSIILSMLETYLQGINTNGVKYIDGIYINIKQSNIDWIFLSLFRIFKTTILSSKKQQIL